MFYDASSVAEQLNAGIQDICSDAILDAYDNTLIRYNDFGSNVSVEFREQYRDSVLNWRGPYIESGKYVEPTAVDPKGLLFEKEAGTYHLNVLRAMIVDDESGAITIESNDADLNASGKGVALNLTNEIVANEKPDPIILKGVVITFIKNTGDENERITKVETDITIDYPSIPYSNQSMSDIGIAKNACIIKGNLIQGAGQGECSIKGGAYFGNAVLSGSGSTMTFKKALGQDSSSFITPGDIKVDGINGSERFTVEDGGTLWANNIIVGSFGAVDLLGDIRVANDLVIEDSDAKVTLAGSYFGFGYSETDSSKSSSIITNFRRNESQSASTGARFDFSGIDSLILAGRAFISSSYRSDITTGESLSVKENQKVYLLPAEMVYYVYQNNRTQLYTNPEKMGISKFQAIQSPGEEYPSDGFKLDENVYVLGKKVASDYGIIDVEIDSEQFPGSNDLMVYAFAKFETPAKATEFFRDYYSAHPEKIDAYMKRSIDLENTIVKASDEANAPIVTSRGYFPFESSQLSGYTPESEFELYVGLADTYQSQYDILKTTLGRANIEDSEEGNPLEFILSEDLHELSGYETYFSVDTHQIVAVAANGNVEITEVTSNGSKTKVIKVDGEVVQEANPDNVCLILATGNIVVDGVDFNGLIVAEGSLELKNGAKLNEDHERVSSATVSTSSDGDSITDFLEDMDAVESQEATEWAVTGLVGYQNWKIITDE
ncbi:MAG: hypothetical protein IJM02_00385 [Clostridia bacterium]|nr:hypothetical protein [Clostridia bacterium]